MPSRQVAAAILNDRNKCRRARQANDTDVADIRKSTWEADTGLYMHPCQSSLDRTDDRWGMDSLITIAYAIIKESMDGV